MTILVEILDTLYAYWWITATRAYLTSSSASWAQDLLVTFPLYAGTSLEAEVIALDDAQLGCWSTPEYTEVCAQAEAMSDVESMKFQRWK